MDRIRKGPFVKLEALSMYSFLETLLDPEDVDLITDVLGRAGYQTCFESGAAGVIKVQTVKDVISRSMNERWSTPEAYFRAVDVFGKLVDTYFIIGVDNLE